MKILMINLPYYGHIVPTIGLIQELIKAGNEVTYLLPQEYKELVLTSGSHFCSYQNHKQLSKQIKNAYAKACEIVDDFDLVLYEQFFFLGHHLAMLHHKPAVRIFTAPLTNHKLMNEFIDKGPLAIFKIKWIARAFTKDIAEGIEMKTDNWLDEIIENPPGLNLVYTLKCFQPYADEFDEKQYCFIGPSIYKRNDEPFDYTKGDKPLIYISLGTVLNVNKKFFKTCIEAFKGEDVEVIMSLGKRFNTKQIKDLPHNIHIYQKVPQIEILKISDVFITHGGMNSISEAMVQGVKILVIPFNSDQPSNARSVEKLGIGKCLPLKQFNYKTLKEATFNLLEDKNIENNLNNIQVDIKKAPGNKGAVSMICDYYEKWRQINQSF